MKKLNIIFSTIVIAVSAYFFFYADAFKTLPGQREIGPAAFPKAVCAALIVCSVILIITEVRKENKEKAELFNLKVLISFAAVAVYFLLLNSLGFIFDSILIIFLMMMLLLNEPFKKAWPLVVSVSILAPVILYVIFSSFLKVPLPVGVISFVLT